MAYTLDRTVSGDFDEIVDETITALENEGFGVLCDIDVQATFKQKLDTDFRQYRILGACNPEQAHQGLQDELLLGTLLPCNVVIYETDSGDVGVSAVDPGQLVGITGNEVLENIAADVHQSFERVLDDVEE